MKVVFCEYSIPLYIFVRTFIQTKPSYKFYPNKTILQLSCKKYLDKLNTFEEIIVYTQKFAITKPMANIFITSVGGNQGVKIITGMKIGKVFFAVVNWPLN